MKEKPILACGSFKLREFHVFCATAILLLALTGFLHFFRTGEVPCGFYADEASVGYNAFCISETGADEYGIRYPVFFKCFDNYQDPVMIYSLVPLIKMFGTEKWVVRFPSGLFHILASIAFFSLASKYAGNRWICLGGAFVFSILPWIFPLSRSGMGGYTPMLFGMAAGGYFIMDAIGRRSMISAVFAGFFWAFT
ncbi:MAG: glycosyltransferase family 39 protein, partial [Lentisphaerae bacterium]|nr:glycosyltransferase family 39 protein [Lentisphaerota bacterium]